jgi:diamine N-acetyltransferase
MRIRFRPIEKGDLSQLQEWRNSDWLRPYVREYRLLSMWHQEKWFEYINESDDVEMFGIERGMPFDDFVGVCGLTNINWVNRTAEISIYVAKKYQGKGIAGDALELLRQKALDEFGLNRLYAEIYAFNTVSIKLFESAGYTLEGRMKQHVWKNGGFHDALIYGLLRGDRDVGA